jgi:nucleoside-diphosphate-sugar epimerase
MILVVGASGYLGSEVARQASAAGHEVAVEPIIVPRESIARTEFALFRLAD